MARRLLRAGLIVSLLLGGVPGKTRAVEPIAYGPFGTVRINGASVSEGTPVLAYCSGVIRGSTTAQLVEGDSRYSLAVEGDDPETEDLDGCLDGETVSFTVDGLPADQTGTWVEGDSVQIDLTATRPEPAITVEKTTNEVDADDPPGPSILVGEPITWTYALTNTGNVTLTEVTVSDDVLGPISCPKTTLIVDEGMECTEAGTADPGQHENLATAEGLYESTVVSATDASHYFGEDPNVDIEKATNGHDADAAPGVFVAINDPITWTFTVTNTGNVDLTDVAVSDSELGAIACGKTMLSPDEPMTCEAYGTAIEGQYENTATVTATPPLGSPVSDEDSSHYFGAAPGLTFNKLTDGVDADTAPGPYALVGNVVTWSYVVTNTGNITFTSLAVTDDQGLDVDCPNTPVGPTTSASCTALAMASQGPYANVGEVTATALAGDPVTATDTSHYFGIAPGIDVEKATNGEDADAAPGPLILEEGPVTWTYVVTNTGNITLTGVTVVDSVETSLSCTADTLGPWESFTCEAAGTATAGQYANTATATGTPPLGPDVSDQDDSHYFGAAPGVSLEKATNGQDADAGPGPFILAGETVTWTYVISNSGSVDLSSITLVDSEEGDVTASCEGTSLAVGEAMTCTVLGVAEGITYTNAATVTATPPVGPDVTDSDASHYFGVDPGIDVEKATNGEDADVAPGPPIRVGAAVEWTYVLSNTGNVTLTAVTVTDDQGVPVSCPSTTLSADEQMVCTASSTADPDQYANVATAVGTPPVGPPVEDTDASHYFGVDPGIVVEKSTNGEEADVAPGPTILVGEPITWTYVVTNTGNSVLSDVTVTDDQLAGFTCSQATLGVRESMTCEATGTAEYGQYSNLATATATPQDGPDVSDTDPSHYFGGEPGLVVEKSTNGHDADGPPGPYILVGDPITWTYVVTNTGNVAMDEVQLVDSQGVTITCPSASLAAGEPMTCTAEGVAVEGQYSNTVTASGVPVVGESPLATASSHYFGADPQIVVMKLTNGEDVTEAPGPVLWEDDPVTWTYAVTNTGNVTLTEVMVTDDRIGTVPCEATTLAVEEETECTAEGVASAGQYRNVGTASGRPPGLLAPVASSDESYYFARTAEPSIGLEKRTNGMLADVAPGVYITVGAPVTWTYTIVNTGNTELTDIVVTDDQGTPDDVGDDITICSGLSLTTTESTNCTLTGTAEPGQYRNVADVSARPSTGGEVTGTAASHYYGIAPGIDVEKAVSPDGLVWHDADDESDALELEAGAEAWWQVVISNTGNVSLTLTVEDIRYGELLDLADVCDPAPPAVLAADTAHACQFQDPEGAREGVGRNLLTAEGRFGASWVGADADAALYVTERKVYLPLVLR